MDVHFQCQQCHQHLVADTGLGGREIPCPKCGQSLVVPAVTSDAPPEIRLSATRLTHHAPPHTIGAHTLGQNLPPPSPAPATAAGADNSKILFTTVAAITALGLFIVAVLNLERIAGWLGGSTPPPQVADARADAEFLKKARHICAQYPTGGDIRAQTGQADVRMDLPAETAQPLARSLAVLYAQTRRAHDAGHGATVTVIHAGGKRATAQATDRSPPVAPPPPPPRAYAAPVIPPAPRVAELPPPPLPRLVREDEGAAEEVPAGKPAEPIPAAGLLADSLADFSDTQGKANWHYGCYSPPFASDGFDEMTAFNAWAGNAWSAASNAPPHAALGRDTCRSAPRLWAVRRWISPTNAVVQISGSFVLTQGAPEWSVTVRVLVDGRPVFARPLTAGDGVVCAARATVREGSPVDIVMENNSDTESPTANCRVQIRGAAAP